MIKQNMSADGFFSHPWRGILVILIFLGLVPPMELFLFAYFQYEWSIENIIFSDIIDVFNHYFVPNIVISYSFFGAQAALSGLYCAFAVARGRALSWRRAVSVLIILELMTEGLIEIILFFFRDTAFDSLLLLVTVLQAVFAASICWLIIRAFRIDQFTLLEND